VLRLLAPRGGERVLDAGCGSGLLTRLLVERGCRVWSVDFCAEMLSHVRGAERVLEANLEDLDLPALALTERFDAIACAGAFNFLDAEKVFERFGALLRPGGVVVILVTRASIPALFYRLSRWIKRVPFRMWSREELRELAARAGLQMVSEEETVPHDIVYTFVSAPPQREAAR
jgi:cyclopropane fatty-acyl-phospholipid synthase-like methyltransferase